MAEFCLDCLNKLEGKHYSELDVWVDYSELDLCEGCGQIKPCVVSMGPKPLGEIFLDLIFQRKKRARL